MAILFNDNGYRTADIFAPLQHYLPGVDLRLYSDPGNVDETDIPIKSVTTNTRYESFCMQILAENCGF